MSKSVSLITGRSFFTTDTKKITDT